MKLIQRISFFILLSITHVNTLTILYIKKIQPNFFLISIVEVLGQNLMIFKDYISRLTFQSDDITLSETWLKPDTNIALHQLNDYYMYRLDS